MAAEGRKGIQWRTMLREATAVLAAILVAFALDAWWDGRVERSNTVEALETIRREIQTNIEQIDEVAAVNAQVIQHIFTLASTPVGVFDTISAEGLADSFGNFGDGLTVTPELGAVTAMVAGGGMNAIRSPELRSRIAGMLGAWEEASEEGEIVEQNGWQVAESTFRATGPLALAHFSGGGPLESERSFFRRLRASEESMAQWTATGAFTQIYTMELAELRPKLVHTLELIDAELGR